MIKKKTQFLVITLLLLITFTLVFNINTMAKTVPEEEFRTNLLPFGEESMDWTLEDLLTGDDITFSSFTGRVVLLDFFSVSLNQSRNFAETLVVVRDYFSSSQLVMISVNIAPFADTLAAIQNFATEFGISWHIVLDEVDMYTEYQVIQIPTWYIFRTDLRVGFSYDLPTDSNSLINKLDEFVKDVNTNTNTGPGAIPDFWATNWYWFVIGGVFLVIVVSLSIQRVRIVNHNKKVRQQRAEEKQKKFRHRNR